MQGSVRTFNGTYFLGKEDECYRCRYRIAIQVISSPSTSSSPGSSPTSVAGQDLEKVSPDANNIRRSRQQHNGCCVSWREGMIASKGAHARLLGPRQRRYRRNISHLDLSTKSDCIRGARLRFMCLYSNTQHFAVYIRCMPLAAQCALSSISHLM